MKNYGLSALIISLMVHLIALAAAAHFFIERPSEIKERVKKIEGLEIITRKAPELRRAIRFKKLTSLPPYIDNFTEKFLLEDKKTALLDESKIANEDLKVIFLPEHKEEAKLEKLPAYMNYYRLIREKIRKNAYSYYQSRERGEVSINFIILKNGELEKLSLNEGSINNLSLRKIALQSIKDAAPFPSFPEELKNFTRLKFNLYIYFKIN